MWKVRSLGNNSIVIYFLSLGNNLITESYILLFKDQYQSSIQTSHHLLNEDWFTIFSIQLISTRCVKLNQFLSSFALPLLRQIGEIKVITTSCLSEARCIFFFFSFFLFYFFFFSFLFSFFLFFFSFFLFFFLFFFSFIFLLFYFFLFFLFFLKSIITLASLELSLCSSY